MASMFSKAAFKGRKQSIFNSNFNLFFNIFNFRSLFWTGFQTINLPLWRVCSFGATATYMSLQSEALGISSMQSL